MYKLFLTLIIFVQGLLFINGVIATEEKRPLKIAVLGAHNPTYDHIGTYAHLNKIAYANKHGYAVHVYTEDLSPFEDFPWWSNPSNPIGGRGYWFKVIISQRHLADYDWLFYLDSDGLIMNDEIKLESLIDDNYDMIATVDGGSVPILSGQFLIKNSKWSRRFLKAWLTIGNNNIQPGFDGGALIQLFNENPEFQKHIKLIPIRKMGSYYWDYQEGDFIIQFAGLVHSEKARMMREYYERILSIKP